MSLGTRLQMVIAVPVLALAGVAGLASTDAVSVEVLALLAAISALVSATLGVAVAGRVSTSSEAAAGVGPRGREPRHRIRAERTGVEMFEQAGRDEVGSLAEALPQGRAFEHGLAALQTEDAAQDRPRFVEPPIDPLPAESSRLRRRVAHVAVSQERPAPAVGSSTRSPEEVRAMLARYRRGLDGARAGEAPPDPESDPSGEVSEGQGSWRR